MLLILDVFTLELLTVYPALLRTVPQTINQVPTPHQLSCMLSLTKIQAA